MKNELLNGFNDGLHSSSGVGGQKFNNEELLPSEIMGNKIIEYTKKYEGTEKYNDVMLDV